MGGKLTLLLSLFLFLRPSFDSVVPVFFPDAAMFHNSSQRKYWTFKSEDEVEQMRYKANQKFRNKILESGKVSST